jgi:hypothetical protein
MTNFWWLTAEEKLKYIYVELAHHKPLKKDDHSPYMAFLNLPLFDIKNISQWRKQYQNTNVYRSLTVWADKSRNDAISGPYIIDIDNEAEDLSDALNITREILEYLQGSYSIVRDDMHIFFSGHKGFNLEVNPGALKIQGTVEEQENKKQNIRKEIIKKFHRGKNLGFNSVSKKGTIIDSLHDHIRLHSSFNKWISKKGEVARMKIELSIIEFNNLSIQSIIAKSERY